VGMAASEMGEKGVVVDLVKVRAIAGARALWPASPALRCLRQLRAVCLSVRVCVCASLCADLDIWLSLSVRVCVCACVRVWLGACRS
jgi:hypothetical protein